MKICERHRFPSQLLEMSTYTDFFLCVWKIFAPPFPRISILLWWWSSFIEENGPRYVYTHVAHLKTKQNMLITWNDINIWEGNSFVFLGISPPPPATFSFPFLLVLVLNNNKKCVKYILDLFTHNLCVFFFSFIFFVLYVAQFFCRSTCGGFVSHAPFYIILWVS